MPGPRVIVVPIPKFVPVPPAPVYHVTTAFVPNTPFAVNVVVAVAHIELDAAVAEVIAEPCLTLTIAVSVAEQPALFVAVKVNVVVSDTDTFVGSFIFDVKPAGFDVHEYAICVPTNAISSTTQVSLELLFRMVTLILT